MKAITREPLLQVFPAGGLQEVPRGRLPNQLVERHVPGALPLPELTRGERIAAIGRPVPFELEVVTRYLPQPELALLLAQRLLDARVVVARVPCTARVRMDPVDHEVDVRVLLVPMCDDEHLVLVQPEVREHAIGDARDRGVVHRVAVIERDGEVVDRLLDTIRLVRRRAHQDARGSRVVGRQVPRFDPVHAVRRSAVLSGLEVANEPGKAAALRDLPDHPILRIAARTSWRVDCRWS